MKIRVIKAQYILVFISVFLILISTFEYAFSQNQQLKKQIANNPTLNTNRLSEALIGGIINKSNLKIGFLNNGRFCAPSEFIPDLPSALFGENGYLNRLDLWVGIPDGPWAPKIWEADSQKFVSMGPTVSGTIYDPRPGDTDWATILATKGVFYTHELLYSDVYKKSDLFDFILAPTSDYERTWPKNSFTGFPEWPGRWMTDPETGDPIEGKFLGDQTVFLAFDDKTRAGLDYPEEDFYRNYGGTFPSQRGYPIGIEVLSEVIGFQSSTASNIIIYDLKLINTSPWNYHDVYLGVYYESDNPWYTTTGARPYYPGLKTDFIKNEFEPQLNKTIPYNLAYNYNKKDHPAHRHPDSSYFGVQLLKTPQAHADQIDNDGDGVIDEAEGEDLGLTGWHYISDLLFYPYRGPYSTEREKLQYKILAGDTSDVNPDLIDRRCFFKNEDGELNSNFDDPEMIYDYSYYGSGNRGTVWLMFSLLSCGPINWASGDTLDFVFGIVVAEDFEKLKTSARIARKVVQNNYNRPEAPPSPNVTAVPGDNKITIYWDKSAEQTEDFITGYSDFEGYKIYRTETDPTNNDWGEPILDHDGNLINFIPVESCDLENGITGYEKVYPHQKLGDDTGLIHTWVDTNVTNGKTYWYSVCAYDHGVLDDELYNPDGFPPAALKESPKGTNPNESLNLVKVIPGLHASNLQTPSLTIESTSQSAGNGPIQATVIDPYAITGHDYLISFEDTTYGFAVYNLYDESTDKFIREKVRETDGGEGIFFDGIQLSVQRFDKLETLNEKTYWYKYETGDPSDCTWRIFGDKLTWDPYPFAYEIYFIDGYETGAFTGKTAPFEIYNTVTEKKCQWDIYFNSKDDTTDAMKNTWTSGDLIYIWDEFLDTKKFTIVVRIFERSYATYEGIVNNPPVPGDAIHFEFQRPFRTGDQFIIRTKSLDQESEQPRTLSDIKVVPNPFIVHSGLELSSSEAKIQFINLPSECTIHIFSMAGDQVRTLHHNDQTDFEFWDLLNYSNLRVSFGLYIFVVETPDGKSTKGKFAILR